MNRITVSKATYDEIRGKLGEWNVSATGVIDMGGIGLVQAEVRGVSRETLDVRIIPTVDDNLKRLIEKKHTAWDHYLSWRDQLLEAGR